MSGEIKLLPCPFCGGEANIKQVPPYYDDFEGREIRPNEWVVSCSKCDVLFAPDTKEDSIKTWNTRTPPPAEKEEES